MTVIFQAQGMEKEDYMKKREAILSFHQRPTETVTLQIPVDTLTSIKQVAETKVMSEQSLLKRN